MQAQTRTERIKKFLIYASSLTAFVFVTFANQPQTLANDVYTWEVSNRSIHSDSTTDYWTPKRLQNAKALPLPLSRTSYAAATPLDTDSLSLELALSNSAVWAGEDGRKPLVKVQPDTTNLLFVPAFRDGVAPFQSWSAAYVVVPGTWATGGGTVPNAADYAMIELNDRTINGQVRRIGEVTGWLGYQTLRLLPNHAHLLGYPCNLDNCQKMHQVTAGSFRGVSPNNVEYGSDMRGDPVEDHGCRILA